MPTWVNDLLIIKIAEQALPEFITMLAELQNKLNKLEGLLVKKILFQNYNFFTKRSSALT